MAFPARLANLCADAARPSFSCLPPIWDGTAVYMPVGLCPATTCADDWEQLKHKGPFFFECLMFFFFLIYLLFNWRITVLQNFVDFCQTSTWISHRCTYMCLPLTALGLAYKAHPSNFQIYIEDLLWADISKCKDFIEAWGYHTEESSDKEIRPREGYISSSFSRTWERKTLGIRVQLFLTPCSFTAGIFRPLLKIDFPSVHVDSRLPHRLLPPFSPQQP